MRPSTRLAGVVAVVVAAVLSGPAWAAQTSQAWRDPGTRTQARHAVFVQTNDPSGNSIVTVSSGMPGWDAGTRPRSYRTGGNGGRASAPRPSDPLTGATYDVDGGQQFTA